MKKKCDWCGIETGSAAEQSIFEGDEHCCMCPTCIIDILPKTPTIEESVNENAAEENSERRRLDRLPVQAQVYFSKSDQIADVIQVLLMDISDAGMKILLKESVNTDESVVLGFLAPNLVYKAIGTIKHVKQITQHTPPLFEAGIRITAIHQELRL